MLSSSLIDQTIENIITRQFISYLEQAKFDQAINLLDSALTTFGENQVFLALKVVLCTINGNLDELKSYRSVLLSVVDSEVEADHLTDRYLNEVITAINGSHHDVENCNSRDIDTVLGPPPTVLIGLPVYSGGEMFRDAIQSILSQDFEDLKLLILDIGQDSLTRQIVAEFQKVDHRVMHMKTNEDVRFLGARNDLATMNHRMDSEFFMWGSYDDRYHPSFLTKAIQAMRADETLAMVYAKTRVVSEGAPDRIANDNISTQATCPLERFVHVFKSLGMCNAWYGLYRRRALNKARAFFQPILRSLDNLFIAEMSLYGGFKQIDEVLFTRGLTRPSKHTYAEQNVDVIGAHYPDLICEGLSMPMVRLTYLHLEMIQRFEADPSKKSWAIGEIIKASRRFSPRIDIEVERIYQSLKDGIFYRTWAETVEVPTDETINLSYLRIHQLYTRLLEAHALLPSDQRVIKSLNMCAQYLKI